MDAQDETRAEPTTSFGIVGFRATIRHICIWEDCVLAEECSISDASGLLSAMQCRPLDCGFSNLYSMVSRRDAYEDVDDFVLAIFLARPCHRLADVVGSVRSSDMLSRAL